MQLVVGLKGEIGIKISSKVGDDLKYIGNKIVILKSHHSTGYWENRVHF